LSFSLLQVRGDSWRHQLDLLAAAKRDGVEMRAQVAPRPVGLMLGLQCTLHPLLTNPVYREISDLSLAERVEIMRGPGFKARVLEADAAQPEGSRHRVLQGFDRMSMFEDPPDYEPAPESSIEARAQRAGCTPMAIAYDLLLEDEGRAMLYVPVLNYSDGNLDAAGEMLADPNTIVGLGDGGAHVSTICDASFPTTLLTLWGRDRDHGRLDLPFLVHRQTQATATAVGLLDRGVLAPGYRADVNVIDFDRLHAHKPEMRYDLPAGGRRLVQAADGYVATFVAGRATYEHGEATDALPGRLVRGPQASPRTGAHG
jgi:N-acyl-D-aspartate/D-glutamate deacylase